MVYLHITVISSFRRTAKPIQFNPTTLEISLPDFGVHSGRDVFQHEPEARGVVGLGRRRVLHPQRAERLPQHGVQHGRPAHSSGKDETRASPTTKDRQYAAGIPRFTTTSREDDFGIMLDRASNFGLSHPVLWSHPCQFPVKVTVFDSTFGQLIMTKPNSLGGARARNFPYRMGRKMWSRVATKDTRRQRRDHGRIFEQC